MLDQTVFHPQGGGQPADLGTIVSQNGAVFAVEHVTIQKNGTIEHHGKFESASSKSTTMACGESVSLEVSA